MVCIIPLRSQSKRLPNKNVLTVDGWPVFHHVLNTSHRSGLFSKIIIAVDKEYMEMVTRYIPLGTIVYERKPENSRDESTIYDLVKEVVEELKIDEIYGCVLYSTSILTTEWHLKRAAKVLGERKYDCVFPIVRQLIELSDINKDGTVEYEYDTDGYKHGDAFFLFNIQNIIESGNIIQDENGYIELKDYESQAVHTQEDFDDLVYKWRAKKANEIPHI